MATDGIKYFPGGLAGSYWAGLEIKSRKFFIRYRSWSVSNNTLKGFGHARIFPPIFFNSLYPVILPFFAPRYGFTEVHTRPVGDMERLIKRPGQIFTGCCKLLFSKRIGMGRGGVLFMRAAIADMGMYVDERRLLLSPLRLFDSLSDRFGVIAVTNLPDMPPVSFKSFFSMLGKSQLGIAFN